MPVADAELAPPAPLAAVVDEEPAPPAPPTPVVGLVTAELRDLPAEDAEEPIELPAEDADSTMRTVEVEVKSCRCWRSGIRAFAAARPAANINLRYILRISLCEGTNRDK